MNAWPPAQHGDAGGFASPVSRAAGPRHGPPACGSAPAVPAPAVPAPAVLAPAGNAHVHWHVAGLPPGVPYAEQQFHALMAENGVLRRSPADERRLGRRIREAIGDGAGDAVAGAVPDRTPG
ncbi:hypothetical protein [Streptomyces sp. NPDC008125]|uniref:hypothetical protein n=1 Tax=Streptomyces sp. NPDC008125 TaxID=3364811 RepID=UPI0036EA837E